MPRVSETADRAMLDLLDRSGPMRISQLAAASHVTPTAIRQRLSRLMAEGCIARETSPAVRGRPSHRYSVTEKGRRHDGANFVDLAIVLWKEIRAVKAPEIRRGLYQRIAQSMAGLYRDQLEGDTPEERMQSVAKVFADRKVPLAVEARRADEARGADEASGQLPVLTIVACPYPQLAEQDRGICAMERMLFAELVGSNVRLSQCRLDGDACCQFAVN